MFKEVRIVKTSKVEVKDASFDTIDDNDFLTPATKERCKAQEILIMPELQDDNSSVFAQEAIPFYKFTKEKNPNTKIDFCADEGSIQERALHSFDIYMPIIFIAANVILPLVVGLVTNYVYDKMKGREHEDCTVKVKFVVKNGQTTKELSYDGSAKDFAKAFEKIDVAKL